MEGFIHLLIAFMICNLFDRLFIDWYWVGHTKAWIIPGTEDLMPYIPKKAVIRKWVSSMIMYPVFAALLSFVFTKIMCLCWEITDIGIIWRRRLRFATVKIRKRRSCPKELSDGKYNNRFQDTDQYTAAILSGIIAGILFALSDRRRIWYDRRNNCPKNEYGQRVWGKIPYAQLYYHIISVLRIHSVSLMSRMSG